MAGNEFDRIQVQFARYDSDGDGVLDSSEFENMCAALGLHLTKQELVVAINMLDKNHDGVIDMYEFTAWFSSQSRNEFV